jgi:L-lactate dehydrogenase (cytochrome)
MKFEAEDPSVVSKSGSGGVDRSQGAARAISVRLSPASTLLFNLIHIQSFIDPGLKWDDLKWFKSITKSKC